MAARRILTLRPKVAPIPPFGYSTTFSAAETPLSESGAWVSPIPGGGTQVNTAGGVTVCTQVGNNTFTDSTACLSTSVHPLSVANYRITATVFRESGFSPIGTREVELLSRCNPTTGEYIEATLAWNGSYAQLVHVGIGGVISNFHYIQGNSAPGPAGGIQDGDIITLDVVGNRWLLKVNGATYLDITATADDSSVALPATGTAGHGYWRSDPPSGTDHQDGLVFTSWSVVAL